MNRINELLKEFEYYSHNPRKQLDKYLSEGKKAIGCFPYYAPEEIVYAAGMVPMGVWGGQGEIAKAKDFFPTFYYSLALRCLEMGLDGTLDGLSASLISTLDDTLRPFSQNYKVGVGKKIPMIFLNHAQHRKEDFGIEYNKRLFERVKHELEEIAGIEITDEMLKNSFKVYNESRAERRRFVKLVGSYPSIINATTRCDVLKSAYFMLKDEHTKLLKELNDELEKLPVEDWDGTRVILSGVMADNPGFLKILDEFKVCIVADDLGHESRSFRTDIDLSIEDPMFALAVQFADTDQDPLLYDPSIWSRPKHVVNLAEENDADGCILLMMIFHDTEEMEYPSLKQAFDKAGIPLLKMGYDQQMVDFAQARTQIQAFTDVLSL